MFRKLFKRKKYNVVIIYKDKIEVVETIASTKREAKEIVSNVLVKCNLFKVQSPREFELKILKKKG